VIHSHPIRYKHPSETKVPPKKKFLLSLNNGVIWFLCLKLRWDDHGSILFQQLEKVYGVSTSIVSTRSRRKGTHCARTHHWSRLAGRMNPRKSDGNLRGSVATVQWKLIATDDSLLHGHHSPIEILGESIASSDYLAALRNSLPSPYFPIHTKPFPWSSTGISSFLAILLRIPLRVAAVLPRYLICFNGISEGHHKSPMNPGILCHVVVKIISLWDIH